jgi:cytochrome c oxidase subunit II
MCSERGAERTRDHRVVRLAICAGRVCGLLVLGACNGTSSYMDATGAAGRRESVLGWWLTGIAAAVVLGVCVAIVLGIVRWRDADATEATGSQPERREIRSGLNWIYVGTAITVVVLLVTFTGTMVTLNAASRPRIAPSLTLDVTGHQWWWEIRYRDDAHPDLGFTTANEVHLPVGQPVRVRLRTADVIHSFWLPQIAGKMDLIPGQVNETWLQAEKPGVSRGMCGEYCGLQHAAMALAVTAESPRQFAQWAAHQRAPAGAPATADAQVGRVVFARSCGACHAVAGTEALGRVGPDLTHVASRPEIGAGALANTPANLARWITAAPQVKEGARMPAIPLDGAQLRSVIAYLETLR